MKTLIFLAVGEARSFLYDGKKLGNKFAVFAIAADRVEAWITSYTRWFPNHNHRYVRDNSPSFQALHHLRGSLNIINLGDKYDSPHTMGDTYVLVAGENSALDDIVVHADDQGEGIYIGNSNSGRVPNIKMKPMPQVMSLIPSKKAKIECKLRGLSQWCNFPYYNN